MRNNLAELPVLLCCIWGGAAAGGGVFLLRMTKRLWLKRFRGRRAGAAWMALFVLLDLLTVAFVSCAFAAILLFANGGEPRLYAVLGFFAALFSVDALLRGALLN